MKKFKHILSGLVASAMMLSAVTAYAQAPNTVVTHDGYLVIECRESAVNPMLDNRANLARSPFTITGSDVARQQNTANSAQFRAHGHITATGGDFRASARLEMGNITVLNRSEWHRSGQTAWSTTMWTSLAGASTGTPRILLHTHADF